MRVPALAGGAIDCRRFAALELPGAGGLLRRLPDESPGLVYVGQ